jgi:hypothetical protein
MTHEEQIETLEVENRMLRARCDRLEHELWNEREASAAVADSMDPLQDGEIGRAIRARNIK